jgi:hypothetical protein
MVCYNFLSLSKEIDVVELEIGYKFMEMLLNPDPHPPNNRKVIRIKIQKELQKLLY